MQQITALKAKNRLGKLLETAQNQPATITRNGRATAVVMSIDDHKRRRCSTTEHLGGLLNLAMVEAKAKGLTEQKHEALLADES